jgi:hypothetical protein
MGVKNWKQRAQERKQWKEEEEEEEEFLTTLNIGVLYINLEGMTKMMLVFIRFMTEQLQADCVCTQIMALRLVHHRGSH